MEFGKLIREDGQVLYEISQIGKFDSFEVWIYDGETKWIMMLN
ncbi:MAG: hypothetical protein ACOCP4_07315 [Candidatus Woesearchaeota archaeon]